MDTRDYDDEGLFNDEGEDILINTDPKIFSFGPFYFSRLPYSIVAGIRVPYVLHLGIDTYPWSWDCGVSVTAGTTVPFDKKFPLPYFSFNVDLFCITIGFGLGA